MDNSNSDDFSELSRDNSREILSPEKKNEKIQFDKTDNKKKAGKKSRSKTPPKRPITPKSSSHKSHKPSQRTADGQDLSDSGLGTSRFEPDNTELVLDHSTPRSSTQISFHDLSNNVTLPEQITRVRRTPDVSPIRPLSARKRDILDKFVDKASSAVTPTDTISEIRSTWTQRSATLANHVRSRFYERMHIFVRALIVGVLLWMALIYGALLGASLCNYGRFSIFPGSSLQKPRMVFY
ncbi:uncharacterized protein [Chelonus insularis]|nr:uncharacterized protein LOC118068947 isoform X2 [Chelonus insularis]